MYHPLQSYMVASVGYVHTYSAELLIMDTLLYIIEDTL